jgi:hypothetical protein
MPFRINPQAPKKTMFADLEWYSQEVVLKLATVSTDLQYCTSKITILTAWNFKMTFQNKLIYR